MIELRLLDYPIVKEIYEEYLEKEFTDDERKPLVVLKILMKLNIYECYGMYEDNELTGYAFMCRGKDGQTILLDYLEIIQKYRGQGYGSKILKLLQEKFADKKYLIAEVESLEQASDEENLLLRSRRRAFYEKNGFKETSLTLMMFNTMLNIYVTPLRQEINEEELAASMNQIYDSLYYDKLIRTRVVLSEPKGNN